METIFVKTRSELTAQMNELMKQGYTCYRVRVACVCYDKPLRNPEMYPRANQRNGVLVIGGNTVISLYVNCKFCSKPPEM